MFELNDEPTGGIEQTILTLCAQNRPAAIDMKEIKFSLPKSDDKARWAAVRRLANKKMLFRFFVDEVEYFSLWEDRDETYVEQPFGCEDESISDLYAVMGTSFPEKIKRTPQFVTLADEGVRTYSRYRSDPWQPNADVTDGLCSDGVVRTKYREEYGND